MLGDNFIIQEFAVIFNTNHSCASLVLNYATAEKLLHINRNISSGAGNFRVMQRIGSSSIKVHINNNADLNVRNSFVLEQSFNIV